MSVEPITNNPAPRVSVVMAVNRIDRFLGPAVESILNQTFRDFEFIVVVDTSCPGLAERILELGQGDRRIKIIFARLGGGLAFSLNLGINEARGEYIARMDGDDISRPDRLKMQVQYLDENPDVAVLGCGEQFIDANSENIKRRIASYHSNEQIRRVLPFKNTLPHPALMFRKSALLAVHGYQYGHYSEDHEMFIRMARDPAVKFHNLENVLYEYRRHASQITHPDNMKKAYAEISGFLYTEFLFTHSPKYLFGMFVVHPWVRRTRLALRKLAWKSDL
jgi:O86/O127-antigen biosynthesis beta-1,3-galactosyltransferase